MMGRNPARRFGRAFGTITPCLPVSLSDYVVTPVPFDHKELWEACGGAETGIRNEVPRGDHSASCRNSPWRRRVFLLSTPPGVKPQLFPLPMASDDERSPARVAWKRARIGVQMLEFALRVGVEWTRARRGSARTQAYRCWNLHCAWERNGPARAGESRAHRRTDARICTARGSGMDPRAQGTRGHLKCGVQGTGRFSHARAFPDRVRRDWWPQGRILGG